MNMAKQLSRKDDLNFTTDAANSREMLAMVLRWIDAHSKAKELAQGLRLPGHAIRLYKYWINNQNSELHLSLFCDGESISDQVCRINAIGYDPLKPKSD